MIRIEQASASPTNGGRQMVVVGDQRIGKQQLLDLQRDATRYRWLRDKADMASAARPRLWSQAWTRPAVLERVGLKRATMYKRMKAGTFPERVQLGPCAVAWDEDKISAWQASLNKGVKKELV